MQRLAGVVTIIGPYLRRGDLIVPSGTGSGATGSGPGLVARDHSNGFFVMMQPGRNHFHPSGGARGG